MFEQFLQGLVSILPHLDQLLEAVVRRILLSLVAAFVNRVHVAKHALEMDDHQQLILVRAAPFEAKSLGAREKARRGLGQRLQIGNGHEAFGVHRRYRLVLPLRRI